jgi:hypothetical protein
MGMPKSEKCATCPIVYQLHDTSHLVLDHVLVCRNSKCADAHFLKGYKRLYALSLTYSILVFGEYWKPCPKPEENEKSFIINN